MTCTCRSALALFLCFSLLSLTCVAQPLAEPRSQRSTGQFPEDQPGFPQYPGAQSGSQAGTTQYPEDQPGFPQYPTSQPTNQRGGRTAAAQAAGSASLNFPPDRNDSVALQCDQLANQPSDAQRIGEGVTLKKIQIDQALPVCEQAAERQPARPRYQYLYGRVLDAAKRYPDAAAQYTAADQAGYALASLALAEMYSEGDGVPKNLGQSQRLYFRAGNAGIADAFAEGGELYFEEDPPNYVQAKSWFENAAQGGSADGNAELGWMYESGSGVNKDPAKALSLFNEAAKRGSAEGMYYLGSVYREGLGVQKDLATACQWFIRAGTSENPYAEAEAGFCYYNGTGVAQDHEAAFRWFTLAGQAGLLDARVYVADMMERGDGFRQDDAGAVQWYQAAAEQGDVYAMTELGAHLRLGKGVAWSEAQAMQWFAKAAQQGYVPAETSLAMGYENGLGQDSGQGRQDYQLAASWYGKAADQNDGYAQLNLGVMYENGWGVPQDLERAKQLYARAAGSSNTAVADLGKQYFDNVPASAPPDRTPQRSVASSSKDSSDFWSVVIVGALAIGAVSLLTSGGSSSSDSAGGYSGSGYNSGMISSTPTSPVSSNPPGWTGDTAPYNPHYTDSARMWKIPMGDLTDPNIAWH
jgi:TPR repeat protein